MKRFILLTTLLGLLSISAMAQGTRLVKGYVQDAYSQALQGAVVRGVSDNSSTTVGVDGTFQLEVSTHCKYVEASFDGYITAQAEIDGSIIVFRLNIDKKYASNKAKAAKKAEQERIAAEEAKAEAEKQARIAAEKRAAAKAKAEEQARIAAEKEAAAKAKAEEQARIAAEKEAAAKAKAEAKEQTRIAKENAKAEKITAKGTVTKTEDPTRIADEKAESLKKEYTKVQKGFGSMVDISCLTGINYSYPSVGLTYTAGYRFNNYLYLGAGVGANINIGAGASTCSCIVVADSSNNSLSPSLVSMPLFVYFRANFIDRPCSPFFALAAGGTFSPKQTLHLDLVDVKYNTNGLFANPQVGVNFRTTSKVSLHFAVGFQCFTMPTSANYTLYNATINSSFGCGIDIHLGFTF